MAVHAWGAEAKAASSLALLGIVTALAGVLLVVSGLMLDTSVATELGARVHNLGLMRQQENLLLVGGLALLIGTVLFVAGRKG
jgi:hypothetical protein